MGRRTFRYDKATGEMKEVFYESAEPGTPAVQGDIEPFRSVVDGTIIRSNSHLRSYMAEKNLVHYDPTAKAEVDRYAVARQDKETRERLYEYVDRLVRTGRGPNQ
jgi:hypothetical protein